MKLHEKLILEQPDRIIQGKDIFMRIYGSGRPLFLLHGNHGSGYVFSKLIPRLEDDFLLVVLDLPGHGYGPPMPDGFMSEPKLASDYCFRAAEMLGLNRFAFCGHSLGGMIGLNLCLEKPERISSLILLDSFVDFHERPSPLVNIKKFPGNAEEFQLEIDEAFADGPGVLWHESYDVSRKLPEISCPVLEMQGESTPDTEELFSQWLKEKRGGIPGGWQIVRVPKAGHFIQLEQPEFVLDEIKRFLKKDMP